MILWDSSDGGNNPIKYVDLDGNVNIAVAALGAKNGKDDNTMISRAIRTGDLVLKASTGKELLDKLAKNSSKKDPIEKLTIFSHGGKQGVYCKKNEGLFSGAFDNGVGTAVGEVFGIYDAATLSDMKKMIENGDIVFADNANIYLSGCDLGTEDFAQELANITGAKVYAMNDDGVGTINKVSGKKSKETGYFGPAKTKGRDGRWFLYQKGQDPQMVGKKLKLTEGE